MLASFAAPSARQSRVPNAALRVGEHVIGRGQAAAGEQRRNEAPAAGSSGRLLLLQNRYRGAIQALRRRYVAGRGSTRQTERL